MFYFRQELLVRENSAAYKVIASKLLFFSLGILYHLIEAVLATYFTVDDHIFILLLKFFLFHILPTGHFGDSYFHVPENYTPVCSENRKRVGSTCSGASHSRTEKIAHSSAPGDSNAYSYFKILPQVHLQLTDKIAIYFVR